MGSIAIKNYLDVKEKDTATDDMVRDKILLRQKVTPKRVTLPNGCSFVARYFSLTNCLLWTTNNKMKK